METPKIVDELLVNLKYQTDDFPRKCFVVFSSREEHVEVAIDCVENVFEETGKYKVIRLDKHLKSGDSQYGELTNLLETCSFAIVILDGFRPNVLFEYGILKGLNKPCIVMLEENATIDVESFMPVGLECPPKPPINMDAHFSDVKDRFYITYNKNKPKEIRALIKDEFDKQKEQIEEAFFNVLFPNKDIVEKELSTHLKTIVEQFNETKQVIKRPALTKVETAHLHVARIATEHVLTLPKRYYWTLASIYAKANKVKSALKTIEGALTGTSDDVQLLALKSRLLGDDGKFDEAISALDAGIALNDKVEYLWHNKGLMLEKMGREDKAKQCYEKAITLDSSCTMLHYHYGILLYEEGNFKSAVTSFDKALEGRPADQDYLLWKARSLDKKGEHSEAQLIIKDIIATDASNADAWFVLGQLAKDDATALPLYQKAIQIAPEHGGAICSSAACLSNLGKESDALELFHTVKEYCQKHETCEELIVSICITLCALDRANEGLERCNEILDKEAEHLGALEGKSICLTHLGKIDDSITLFKNILKQKPKDAGLIYNLACAYALNKKNREAIANLQKAIKLNNKFLEMSHTDTDFDKIRNSSEFKVAFP